jgi:phage terminase Nu1 subunit (DNA packaging protein)
MTMTFHSDRLAAGPSGLRSNAGPRRPEYRSLKLFFVEVPMAEKVTKRALAELVGVTGRTITDLAKRDIIVREGAGYALAASVQGYCKHLRQVATGRGGEAAISTATAARARLASEQADAVALKNARLRGALLDAGAVEAEWSGVLRTVRAGMLTVPSRCSARLPHLSKHDVAEIDAEVRAALVEIGGSPSSE